MKDSDILIVGGGFPGIYVAWRALRAGLRVTLVEASDRLGGNLRSFRWRGHDVDWGTHNLDLRSKRSRDFFGFALGDRLREIPDHRWASLRDRVVTPGFECPDFSDDQAFCDAVLDQMAAIEAGPPAPPAPGAGWLEWYRASRGALLADAIAPMVRKFSGIDPKRLSAAASGALGFFNRPLLGSDARMVALKRQGQFWNDRLGVTLACGETDFVGRPEEQRFGYPAEGGIGGFGATALEHLRAAGATVLLDAPVRRVSATGRAVQVVAGDHELGSGGLFLSLPGPLLDRVLGRTASAATPVARVGCLLLVWQVAREDILGPHYLHDFGTERLAFRYSAPGVFGGEARDDGLTFVIAEIPGPPEALSAIDLPGATARCFDEMRAIGYLRPQARPRATTSCVVPTAFVLPLLTDRKAPQPARADPLPPRCWVPDPGLRGRVAFMDYCDNQLIPAVLRECAVP